MTNQIRLKGQILSINPDRKFGFIETEAGEVLFFYLTRLINCTIEIGNYVTFTKVPSKKFDGKFEAVNITRAYLSLDNYYVVNRPFGHLHEQIVGKLETLVKSINCNGRSFIVDQIDYSYPIGCSICVKVNQEDEVIYAIRKGRKGYTKFVKNRKPESTNSITIVLQKTNDFYTIITAYIGKKAELEPWDERATEGSFKFWEDHALIFGTEEIELISVRTDCPWNESGVDFQQLSTTQETISNEKINRIIYGFVDKRNCEPFYNQNFDEYIDECFQYDSNFLNWVFENKSDTGIYFINQLNTQQLDAYNRLRSLEFFKLL